MTLPKNSQDSSIWKFILLQIYIVAFVFLHQNTWGRLMQPTTWMLDGERWERKEAIACWSTSSRPHSLHTLSLSLVFIFNLYIMNLAWWQMEVRRTNCTAVRGPWSNCMMVQIQLYQGHLTRVIWVGLNVTPNHLRCECEEAIACWLLVAGPDPVVHTLRTPQ